MKIKATNFYETCEENTTDKIDKGRGIENKDSWEDMKTLKKISEKL